MSESLLYLNLLPPKFGGTVDENSLKFVQKFKDVIKSPVFKVLDEHAVSIFFLWLEGDADDWAHQIRDDHGNFKIVLIDEKETEVCWSVEDWTDALYKKFPVWNVPVLKKENTIQDLGLLKPDLPLTIDSLNKFNHDFQLYVNGIPTEEKTDMQVLKAYKNSIAYASREVYLNVEREHEHSKNRMTLQIYMEKYLKELALQLSVPIVESSTESKKVDKSEQNDQEKTSGLEKMADSLVSLTKQMGDLTLLVSKERRPDERFGGNVTCFNCGMRGHVSKNCDKPRNESEVKKRRDEFEERKNSKLAETLKGSNENPKVNAIQKISSNQVLANSVKTVTGKRARISDLLNDTEPMQVEERREVTKESKAPKSILKKKKATVQRKGVSTDNLGSSLANKLLNSHSSLTWKQILGLVSQNQKDDCVKAFKQNLNAVKPRRLVLSNSKDMYMLETDSDEEVIDSEMFGDPNDPVNRDVNEFFCYTLLKINESTIPAFLDKGSHLSIITETMCEKLKIDFAIEKGKFISPYGGEKMPIIGVAHVILEIVPEVKVKIQLAVVKQAIVPFLIGLDILQPLGVSEDYENNIVYWNTFKSLVRTQLFSKQELQDMDDVDDSEEDAYYTFHLAQFEVMDVGVPSVEDIGDIYTKDFKQESLEDTIDDIDPLPFKEDFAIPFVRKVDDHVDKLEMNIDSKDKQELKDLIVKFQDIFPESISEMKRMKNVEFSIKLKEGMEPKRAKPKFYSDKERQVLDDLINIGMNSKNPFLRWSSSSYGENFTFAPKPDGSLRVCTACVRLNNCTVLKSFPVPLIDDCLKFAADANYCSILDCLSGYWQMPVEEKSRKYLAFHTHRGLVEFMVLPFGVRNGVFVFQEFMETAFQPLMYQHIRCYLDDIFAKSLSVVDHLLLLEKIFLICREHGISLKLSKCKFFAKEYVYLGYLFHDGLIHPNPSKVDALLLKAEPSNVKELRTFIGMVEYFSRFIPNLASILYPLRILLQKNAFWNWNLECKESFETAKKCLAESPCLKIIDDHNELILSTDASRHAIGACLEQYDDSQVLHPVAFYSKVFQGAQKNYSTYEKECLAIVESLKKFRSWLLGRSFVCFTDNTAVAKLLRQENDPYGRQARWCQFLSEFEMVLKHRVGKENQVADYLSRSKFVNVCFAIGKSQDIGFEDIRQYLLDGHTNPGIVNDARFRRTVKKYCVIMNELYRYDVNGNHVKVLYTKAELFDILKVLHNQLGHFGFKIVAAWVFPKFWRPHIGNEIKEYVKSCNECQIFDLKRPDYKFSGKSEIGGVFHCWSIDYLGPFPKSDKGNCYILNCIEHLSRFPYGEAVCDTTSLSSIGALKNLITLYGVPKSLRTDHDSSFCSKYFREYCAVTGMKLEVAPSYTPEWLGMVERLNGIVRYALAKCCIDDYSQFESYLPEIYFGIRAHIHSDTGHSPFYVLYGVEPSLPISNIDATVLKNVSLKAREVELALMPGIRAAITRAKKLSKTTTRFSEGQHVKILVGSLRKSSVIDKKKPRYVGPYEVIQVYPYDLYKVKDEYGKTIDSIHVSRLLPYYLPVNRNGGAVKRNFG